MHSVNTPGGRILAMRPEDLVRAFAVANALGLSYPPQNAVAWMQTTTPAYDGGPAYWQPYARVDPKSSREIHILPWARGTAGYLSGLTGVGASLGKLDPTVWYQGLRDRVRDWGASESAMVAFELAHEQTDPNGPFGDDVIDLYAEVRAAAASKNLLIDPSRISRRLRAVRENAL